MIYEVLSVKTTEGKGKNGRYWWQEAFILLDDGTMYAVRHDDESKPLKKGDLITVGLSVRFGKLDLLILGINS